MEKSILEQYIDACELIKETEEDIQKLKKEEKDDCPDECFREQSRVSL